MLHLVFEDVLYYTAIIWNKGVRFRHSDKASAKGALVCGCGERACRFRGTGSLRNASRARRLTRFVDDKVAREENMMCPRNTKSKTCKLGKDVSRRASSASVLDACLRRLAASSLAPPERLQADLS